MKFEDLDENDREIFLNKKYSPASELFGEELKNWHYYDFYVDAPKSHTKKITVNGSVHEIPIRGHVYLFRWMMPPHPCIYSIDDHYTEKDLKSLLFRFTVGDKPFLMGPEEIQKIIDGEIEVSPDFIADIDEKMELAFSFNVWKIPLVHVSVDEYNFTGAWGEYSGEKLENARLLEADLIAEQEREKSRLLEETLKEIQKYPDYLSTVRRLIQRKISFDEAIEEAGVQSSIIVKGI